LLIPLTFVNTNQYYKENYKDVSSYLIGG